MKSLKNRFQQGGIHMETKAKIITVAGKGGVGKTSICACIVRLLVEKYPDKKILAIDADPAVGLSTALVAMFSLQATMLLTPSSFAAFCVSRSVTEITATQP